MVRVLRPAAWRYYKIDPLHLGPLLGRERQGPALCAFVFCFPGFQVSPRHRLGVWGRFEREAQKGKASIVISFRGTGAGGGGRVFYFSIACTYGIPQPRLPESSRVR